MPVRVEGHVDRIDFIAQLCCDHKVTDLGVKLYVRPIAR